MGVRYRRGISLNDSAAMREFAEQAYPGRHTLPIQVRLRRLIDLGSRLEMTPGDAARVSTETLRALDAHNELEPALADVLASFDSGRLRTEFREPMNQYLDRSAVTALSVAVCEECRPAIAEAARTAEVAAPERVEVIAAPDGPEAPPPAEEIDVRASQQSGESWPERTRDGFPKVTLQVMVWWPGLPAWEPATLTARISPSLAFTGDNFTLSIEQEGDPEPAESHAVWMVQRPDLREKMPVFELRASTWEVGSEPHEYRFLVASSSPWCHELHDYLATRWISKGLSPTGPQVFDAERLGGNQPRLGPFVTLGVSTGNGAPAQSTSSRMAGEPQHLGS
ncbi:MAG: hypothetical protein HKN80_06285 [Acidimicrobiia bacterium]|nr:hypothetical protein [Acidimicrobiia bacterium]